MELDGKGDVPGVEEAEQHKEHPVQKRSTQKSHVQPPCPVEICYCSSLLFPKQEHFSYVGGNRSSSYLHVLWKAQNYLLRAQQGYLAKKAQNVHRQNPPKQSINWMVISTGTSSNPRGF